MEGEIIVKSKQNKEKSYRIITMAFSVLAAFILWMFVMNDLNPSKSITYNGFAVTLTGAEQIHNAYGLSVIQGQDSTVSLELTGARNQHLDLKADRIKVTADISGLTTPGTYELPYDVQLPTSLLNVSAKNPETIQVTVDKIIRKIVPVEIGFEGKTTGEYYYEQPAADEETVAIKGPMEEVSRVKTAYVAVSASNLVQTTSQDYEYVLLDEEGNEVRSPNITKESESVRVTVPVRLTKTVPVKVDIHYEEGIEPDDVTVRLDREEVSIRGNVNGVNSITELVAGTVNTIDVQGTKTVEFKLQLPEGVSFADGSASTVKATVTVKRDTMKTYFVDDILITDTAEDERKKNVTLRTQMINVQISGAEEELARLTADDLSVRLSLDSSEYIAGNYSAPVEVTAAAGFDVKVVGSYSVNITVEDI